MASLSLKIVDFLTENGTINPEDRELISYGLHQGMFMIINILTTLAIGLAFGMLWQCIVFMVAYLPLRSFAGGYHAKTELSCYIFSVILIIVALLLIKYFPWTNLFCLLVAFLSCAVILLLAPVEDENKPLDSKEVKVYKKKTIQILGIEVLALLLFVIFNPLQVSVCVSASLLALSVMLVLGKFKNIISGRQSE